MKLEKSTVSTYQFRRVDGKGFWSFTVPVQTVATQADS